MKWYFYHNRKLREFLDGFMTKIVSKSSIEKTKADVELVNILRQDFSALGKIEKEGQTNSEQIWINNMNRLYDLVLNDDPSRFLHWDVIQKAMFITNALYVSIELSFLKRQPTWRSRWKSALKESEVGSPIPYWLFPASSGNLIHHGYHISQFEKKLQTDVSKLEYVVECGGGYGSMCRLFRNLGFKGTYLIFDLPHFSALQKYYLSANNICVQKSSSTNEMTVQLVSDVDELEEFITPIREKDSLFLATWSLSEMPLDLRYRIQTILKNFSVLFLAYQSVFEEVDNVQYFEKLIAQGVDFDWKTWEIESLPTHYYMAGSRL